jgi:hypothetical protein
MEYFTTRNTVIAALVQVGVIVGGVLAAGACIKWYSTFGLTPFRSTTLLAEYGLLALVLPLVWVTIALRAQQRSHRDEEPSIIAFLLGILLLLLLLGAVWYSAARPLFRLLNLW